MLLNQSAKAKDGFAISMTRVLVVALSLNLVGCASSRGPEVLTIAAEDYPAAFDAAVEAVRREGLPALLRDRRAGVIESDVRAASTILEPWRSDNASVSQALENTIAYQRRRVRFEFMAPGGLADLAGGAVEPVIDGAVTDGVLTGPDVLGVQAVPQDLTQAPGPLELRVWVYVERANVPGLRRFEWTRSKTTRPVLVAPEGEAGLPAGQYWTTIARDPAFERRLLAQVEQALAKSQ